MLYLATKSGKWSDLSTWRVWEGTETSASPGKTPATRLPNAEDVVYLSSHSVTADVYRIEVKELRSDVITEKYVNAYFKNTSSVSGSLRLIQPLTIKCEKIVTEQGARQHSFITAEKYETVDTVTINADCYVNNGLVYNGSESYTGSGQINEVIINGNMYCNGYAGVFHQQKDGNLSVKINGNVEIDNEFLIRTELDKNSISCDINGSLKVKGGDLCYVYTFGNVIDPEHFVVDGDVWAVDSAISGITEIKNGTITNDFFINKDTIRTNIKGYKNILNGENFIFESELPAVLEEKYGKKISFLLTGDFKAVCDPQTLQVVDQADQENLARAEAFALEEINSYLGGRYNMAEAYAAEYDKRNPLLVMFACDIALYHLVAWLPKRIGFEIREIRYKSTIERLRDIQNGKANMDLPVLTDNDGNDIGTPVKFGGWKKSKYQY